MRMACADVQKVLGSAHSMDRGCNVVVLDGEWSCMQNKQTNQKTNIECDDGQCGDIRSLTSPTAECRGS